MRSIVWLLLLIGVSLIQGKRHIRQSINQSTDRSINQQSIDKESINQPINQSINDDDILYVWPLPSEYKIGQSINQLSTNFSIDASPMTDDMRSLIDRYMRLMFVHHQSIDQSIDPSIDSSIDSSINQSINRPMGVLSQLLITFSDPDAVLQMGVDESYTLTIDASTDQSIDGSIDGLIDASIATLTAQTYYGILRGLETFSQLVTYNFDGQYYQINQVPLYINDQPRFAHRGFMIDTARHYQSINTIKQFIDSLTFAKFNVLHWHMVDDQSIPYHSDALPRFSQAAYRSIDRYSTGDVSHIVEYARQRGIRVYLEFDTPGHAQAWCVGYPEVCPDPRCLGPLDPSQNATFAVIKRLFGEITGGKARKGIVPEDLFHLGGDEVNLGCYNTVPRVAKWLDENGMTAKDGYKYMVDQAQQIVHSMGRQAVNWQEVYENFGTSINQSTIIHVWKDPSIVYNITRDGFRVLFSPDTEYYLNRVNYKWEGIYTLEPTAGLDEKQAALVIGGEACVWGEYVDGSDLQSTAWPRAAAIAERLWSPKGTNNVTAATPRYANFRCMLNGRGVASSLAFQDSRVAPSGPGPCLSQ